MANERIEERNLDAHADNDQNDRKDHKEPRKRPDRAEKLMKRHGSVETVVKACLLKHLSDTDVTSRMAVRNAIRSRVLAFSKRYHAASLGMLHIVVETLGADPHASLDHIFDVTFFRQLMLGTEDAKLSIPQVASLHERLPDLLENTTRFLGDRNIYSAGAIKYVTNLKNHMRTNILRIIKKVQYSSDRLPGMQELSNDAMRRLVREVAGWTSSSSESSSSLPPRVMNWVNEQRSIMGLQQDETLDDTWIDDDSNLSGMIRYFAFANKHFEAIGEKVFVMVPISKIRTHFITIDTSVLHGIVKEVGDVKCNFDTFKALAIEHWQSVFNLNKLIGKNGDATFTRTIETDGISVCVHRMRPKTEGEMIVSAKNKTKKAFREAIALSDNDRVIGVDPGKRTIYHCAELMADGSYRSLRFSSSRYQRESGMLQERKHTRTWNKEIRKELRDFSTVSPKGLNVVKLALFMEVYNVHKRSLWTEYTRDRWGRQRLRLYGGKKRSFAKFFDELKQDPECPESPRRVVLAYGNANFPSGGSKGKQAVPTTRAYRECAQRVLTIDVDEFRTSRVHWETGKTMDIVGRRDRSTAVRGLLWCGSTNQTNGKFVDRDLNAAINIRRCLLLPRRPVELQRKDGQPALNKTIRKWIMR
jgi:transposase